MKIKNYLLILVISLIFFSCSKDDEDVIPEKEVPQVESQAGIVLTFDDDFVDEWFTTNNLLKPYDWKATFFVTKFNQLSTDKVQKLKILKEEGHEIAAHGLNHLNAPAYIGTHSNTSYLEEEIFPMLKLMNENNLTPTSFAYPYGARDTSIDQILLNEFQIIRGTTYGQQNPAYQNCYYNNRPLVFGLGIDNSYPHFSIPYFISLLEYAKKNNRIVIFYSHKPVATSNAAYETEYQTLIEICKFVKNSHMKFYKISELYHLKNDFTQNRIAYHNHKKH